MFNDLFLSDSYFTNRNMRGADDGSDPDAAPDVQAPPPGAGDISALTGAPAQPAAPIAGPAPSAPAPTAPAAPAAAPAPVPNVNDAGQPTPPTVQTSAPAPTAPTAPIMGGQPSPWKSLVMGALIGAANGAGGKGFGQGSERGAQAVSNANQQAIVNKQNAQKLQFESVQAANDAIRARNEARAADDAHEEHALQLDKQHLVMAQTMKALGIDPTLSIQATGKADGQAQATGGLQTLADRNGGKIPQLTATNSPDHASADGKTHVINVYAPNNADIKSNPNGYRTLVDEVNRAKTGQPLDDSTWQSGGGNMLGDIPDPTGGQRKLVNEASQFLLAPAVEENDQKNAAISANLHQQAETYAANSQANPQFAKALQAKADTFDSAMKQKGQLDVATENSKTSGTSATKAAAAQATKQSETQGEINVNTAPGNVAKESAAKAAYAKAEAQAKNESDSKPAYAVDSQGNTVLTTSAAAAQNGMTAIRPVKEGDITKDQHDLKVLSDIQIKSDNVKQQAAAMDDNSWKQAGVAAKYLADNPNTPINTLMKSEALKNASPQVQSYIIAVNSLRESSMGLQKVLTGTARASETQIQALQNTLPGVEPNSATVHQKLQAFDQNLGMLSQGLPTNTGVKSAVHGPEITVSDPRGVTHYFKDQAAADQFKKTAGIQ
jgi:hypothetical protein